MTKTKGSVVALRPSCPGEFRDENHENMKEGPCRSKIQKRHGVHDVPSGYVTKHNIAMDSYGMMMNDV